MCSSLLPINTMYNSTRMPQYSTAIVGCARRYGKTRGQPGGTVVYDDDALLLAGRVDKISSTNTRTERSMTM
ncbi:unnamed protein product, partial [Sphacelaria rigidula]